MPALKFFRRWYEIYLIGEYLWPGMNRVVARDPWGGKRGNDGPPDLDEALNQLKKKFSSFGGGSNGSGGP